MAKWIIAGLIFLFGGDKVPTLTPSEIFARNSDAVVQIFVNGRISGCGFIVSSDGLVFTANHVVTTEESKFTEVSAEIEVRKIGQRSHVATVISQSIPSDTALLRIIADDLPHVAIGDLKSVQPSSAATMITFLPDSRANVPLLVTGTVSGVGVVNGANAIVLQMPIRKGFSGSPVFGADGRVIGIITTRLVGISPDLAAIRIQLRNTGGAIILQGADFRTTILGLIDSLDADLVSGLGSAVDISYAKQMLVEAHKKN